MFHLLKNVTPTYTWPVVAKIPADGGKLADIKFDAEFNRISDERLRELADQENDSRPKTDIAMLDGILVSASYKDETGAYGPISDKDSAELYAVPGVARSIVLAFLQSRSGEKAKN